LAKVFEETIGNNPLAKLAQHNITLFKTAASAFMPGNDKAATSPSEPRDDLAALREQMAEMQRKLDAMGK
jgi:polyhydroxyalkanoate synthesis regulator protein